MNPLDANICHVYPCITLHLNAELDRQQFNGSMTDKASIRFHSIPFQILPLKTVVQPMFWPGDVV